MAIKNLIVFTCWWSLTTVFQVMANENLEPLPVIVTPIHYRLTLLPVLEDNPRLCGHVWIDVKARAETNLIVLHASDLTIIKAIVLPVSSDASERGNQFKSEDGLMVENFCFATAVYHDTNADDSNIALDHHADGQKQLSSILLREVLKKGAYYRIGLLYTGNIYEANKGFFRATYEVGNKSDCCKRTIAATQLEAIHARRLFPCIDEPAQKATFQLMVGHHFTLKAINNMPLKSSTRMSTVDNWVWDTFDTTPVMSTYLLACVLTEFNHVETTYHSISGKDVAVRLWTHQHRLGHLDFALNLIPKALNKLENYLGVPYSLPKLDVVALPGYEEGKAMENWGLIIHSEMNLLVDETTDDIDKSIVGATIVHELAHQWFGNLVSSTSWDDIWTNEGLTTLFESAILEQVASDLEYETVMLVFLQEVMRSDLLSTQFALSAPASRYPSVDEKFDVIAYAKGAAIFRMARSFVGEEAFQSAIRRYLNKYQYASANSTDLWNLINQEARRTHTISGRMNVARIMKTWTQQPGYPLIHVHRSKNGIMHISQRPFKNSDSPPKENATMAVSVSWWVPISMTNGEDLKFSPKDRLPVAWLSPRKPSMELQGTIGNNTWVLVNPQVGNYYRVNYDRRNWDLLAEQLMRNHTVIPFVTRSQLVDDAFVMGHAKIISYDVALELIRYLSHTNDDVLIRRMAQSHIQFLEGIAANSIQNPDKKKMIKNMSSFITRERKSRMAKMSAGDPGRGDCDSGDHQCVNKALLLFRDFIDGTIQPRDDRSANTDSVWCAAVRHGSQPEWNFAWNTTTSYGDQMLPETRKMLKAMCCTTDSIHAKQLLTRVLHPNIKQGPKETLMIMQRLVKNPSVRQVAVTFILSNWDFLDKYFKNPYVMSELLTAMAKHSYSIEELEKVKAFVVNHSKELTSGGVSRIMAAINNNMEWLELATDDPRAIVEY
ncbi:thyrotropin-releasing hormone-degrading ectoenzyme-like [Daphnia carinata]|uniref:thyrotropin-releasing hormone-degrading ectoenzyme-like n=1 Tax=Daphnia carinata TaxID=120202 RepID=UPI00257BBDBE|nr:thyrotropin-releasing hormone-degrading ectoenzyme-like [Daphnia carinata]